MTTESQSPPATVTREQAVEAAKEHTKLCCDCMEGKAVDYRPCIMARYILQPAPPAEAFDASFFLRNVLSQGGAIQQDFADKPYEEYARRLDCAAVERADELAALIAAQGRAGDVVPDNVRYWANRVIEETAGIPTECDHEFVGGLHQCEHCGWDSVEFGAVTLARHVIAIPSPTPATE